MSWKDNAEYRKKLSEVIVCPFCLSNLNLERMTFRCSECGDRYPISETGQPDLRLQRKKVVRLEVAIGQNPDVSSLELTPLKANPLAENDFKDVEVPLHLTRELMSYFPRAICPESLVLDIGCGNEVHRTVCEQAGFCYVGLDAHNTMASVLGNGHALPFKDESFEFVLSIATFEHLSIPLVAIQEISRVLKKGGKLIGTVAFLQPFHANSFFHMTHMGVISLLNHGGFKIVYIAPSRKWSVLFVQARMALFPRMPSAFANSLVLPIYILHRIWWLIGRVFNKGPGERHRVLSTTGDITFIATKN